MLEIRSLSFAYGTHRVVDLWSHSLGAGLTWLRGANGTGKSTRLKLLAGGLPPLYGSASLQGVDLLTSPLEYRRRVSWVGAEPPPFEHLSPQERFEFLSGLYPNADVQTWQAQVQGFGLQNFVHQPLRELSSGTQHKAALASALALRTPLLLLDEPFNALDQPSQGWLREQLIEAAAAPDRCVLIVSHEALGFAPSAELLLT